MSITKIGEPEAVDKVGTYTPSPPSKKKQARGGMSALAGPVVAKPTKSKIKTEKAVKVFVWHRVLNNDPKYIEENLWKKTEELQKQIESSLN